MLGVGVEELLLDLRDERLRPVGLALCESGGQCRVVAVGDVVQFGNREVAAPVVVARLEGDRLGRPVRQRVGAGACLLYTSDAADE